MKKCLTTALLCSFLVFMSACDDGGKEGKPSSNAQETPQQKAEIISDRLRDWRGQWNGPADAFLKVEKSGDGYGITIKSAEKEERYLGVGVPGLMKIRFRRGDTDETIHLGTGFDSGVKELMEKPFCLIVKKGEAYCRDKM